jgi:hypothetical protein
MLTDIKLLGSSHLILVKGRVGSYLFPAKKIRLMKAQITCLSTHAHFERNLLTLIG